MKQIDWYLGVRKAEGGRAVTHLWEGGSRWPFLFVIIHSHRFSFQCLYNLLSSTFILTATLNQSFPSHPSHELLILACFSSFPTNTARSQLFIYEDICCLVSFLSHLPPKKESPDEAPGRPKLAVSWFRSWCCQGLASSPQPATGKKQGPYTPSKGGPSRKPSIQGMFTAIHYFRLEPVPYYITPVKIVSSSLQWCFTVFPQRFGQNT